MSATTQNTLNVRTALKMLNVVQNLILDLKMLEAEKSENLDIQQINDLLAVKKRCDIQVEMLNLERFVKLNKVDMSVLNM